MDTTNPDHDYKVLNSMTQNSQNGIQVDAGNLHWNVVGDHSFTDEGYFLPNSSANGTSLFKEEQCTIISCTKQEHKIKDTTEEIDTRGVLCMGK